MTHVRVTSQAELDHVLESGEYSYDEHEIIICSPADQLIVVTDDRGLDLYASGSATVSAYGSATVSAYGSATVRAYDSATVSAYGSATVSASGSATVRAYDSATVSAYGSATVSASGSATVSAYDSATVRASGSATVSAYDSATVSASGLLVVTRKLSTAATVTGGVIIDVTAYDESNAADWCALNQVQGDGETVTLYKALPADLTSGIQYAHPTTWPLEGEVACDDWQPNNGCGGGLHLSPTPAQAQHYLDNADLSTARFLECRVSLTDLHPILDGVAKAKAPRVTVIREVDIDGNPISEATK
ncbi:hypothetical protein [Actinobaculum sp. 352]|uniref:DUF7666 domain-containing protein n=1 Tax=Actinobaculum sp. 352 TaxID=2490946 RepID=UPI000F7EF798|nr:hypothetical protein [Actinobaculum sp. 352]RTE49350.1 hypothetical protein EKN07_07220 [Actinobaculum sp. 352]